MSIREWPDGERPRDKLLAHGATSLSDAELLAIFLRTGSAGVDAVALARQLLLQFGSLRELMSASQAEFCLGIGLGEAKYAQMQALTEMARRYFRASLDRGDSLTSPQQSKDYLLAQLSDRNHEVFAMLMLDNQHRVIRFEEVFHGTIDRSAVYPRVLVEKVLRANAAAVILAHNHPSGVAEPSQADRRMTERIESALNLIDVRVLDHIVVGDGQTASFAERGWL